MAPLQALREHDRQYHGLVAITQLQCIVLIRDHALVAITQLHGLPLDVSRLANGDIRCSRSARRTSTRLPVE